LFVARDSSNLLIGPVVGEGLGVPDRVGEGQPAAAILFGMATMKEIQDRNL
jgi:hypothetical protein